MSAAAPHHILVVHWEWAEGPHKGARFWASHSTSNDGRCADWPGKDMRPLGAAIVQVVEGQGLDLIAQCAAERQTMFAQRPNAKTGL